MDLQFQNEQRLAAARDKLEQACLKIEDLKKQARNGASHDCWTLDQWDNRLNKLHRKGCKANLKYSVSDVHCYEDTVEVTLRCFRAYIEDLGV